MKLPLLCITLITGLAGQVRVGEWQSITSPLTVNEIIASGDTLICATNGGLMLYKNDNSFEVLTNLDGLAITSLNTVFKGPQGFVWIAGEGIIQVYDIQKHRSLGIFDDLDLDEVVKIDVFKDVIYGVYRQGKKWGLIEFVFSNGQYFYRDLYEHPTIRQITGLAISGETMYLGTDVGLMVGNPHQTHISRWEIPFSQLSTKINVLEKRGDELALSTNDAVYSFNLSNGEINMLYKDDNRIKSLKDIIIIAEQDYIGISDTGIYSIQEDVFQEYALNTAGYRFESVTISDSKIILGSDYGLVFLQPDLKHYAPDSPIVDAPTAISILPDGLPVLASAKGFSFHKEESWLNYGIRPFYSDFSQTGLHVSYLGFSLGEKVRTMVNGSDGNLYCALEGTNPGRGEAGIAILNISGEPGSAALVDSTVLPYFISDRGDSSFKIMDLTLDLQSNLWVVSLNSQNRPLSVMSNGKWKSFTLAESESKLSRSVTSVVADNFNRIWVGAAENSVLNAGAAHDGGLVMLKISGDPAAPEKQTWVSVDVNPGYQNRTVYALAVSPRNRLFILTPVGLFYKDLQISESDPVLKIGPLTPQGNLYPYFPNVSFEEGSRLRIGPRGNVWVSSPTQGLRVLLENGEYWPDVEGLTRENSFLLSNRVSDMDFDDAKGLAYIATDRGVSVIRIPFAEKKTSYSHVEIFPSPFRIPSERPLVIANLKDGSAVKIMALNGRVVRSIPADSKDVQGYQAFWDGRDDSGRWVGSGVYLISVYDKKGSSTMEKITVIRH